MIFESSDIQRFKQQALQWANRFKVCCYLDSNQRQSSYSQFDALLAVSAKYEVVANAGNAFEKLENFRQQHQGWMTGFLGYDLKNEVEQTQSSNTDRLNFPDLYFFIPEYLIVINGYEVNITANDAEDVWAKINAQPLNNAPQAPQVKLRAKFSKQQYTDNFDLIKEHISRGDIYVTNFCQEFFAEDAIIDPLSVFNQLNQISPTPFASYFKYHDRYIICASPERFLAKRGNKLISQPIKGTARRGTTDAEDKMLIYNLRNNLKEQQENVMIVDLVRNDLTKSAKPGTVKTEELFGIYTFEQVHQMISTVTCQIEDSLTDVAAIRNSFPMGSMTGAPKLSAMQLMERYERTRRGIYSGAVGYFSPQGEFDFNVVIRTILYNASNKYLSFQVGSAITFDAIAEQEYAECLLKAQAILQVLKATLPV
jgi:para-aminobenzoate synthetase component 1